MMNTICTVVGAVILVVGLVFAIWDEYSNR